jgi:spermidine synthase
MKMIYNEMLVQVPMCSHDKIDLNVCLINPNDDIKKELSYHKNIKVTEIADESGLAESENEFDIIISTKPVSSVYMNRSLTSKGIAVQPCESLTDTKTFEEAGKLMYINQPYWFFDENFEIQTILFSSKKYHGQADIVRNKSDFIEHTEYYNTDMHISAFNYPTKIFKQILPSIKI